MDKGRIQNLLRLFVTAQRPPMNGQTRLKAREFARKIREHLKNAKHAAELTKHLERLAADAYAVANMPGWDDQEMARKGLKSLGTPTAELPANIEMPLPPKKK